MNINNNQNFGNILANQSSFTQSNPVQNNAKRYFTQTNENDLEKNPKKIRGSLIKIDISNEVCGKVINTTADLWSTFKELFNQQSIDLIDQNQLGKNYLLSKEDMEVIVRHKLSIPVSDFFKDDNRCIDFNGEIKQINRVERELLTHHSSYFNHLWNGNLVESQNSSVTKIDDISKDNFTICLNYLKNPDFILKDLENNNINELITLLLDANRLAIDSLTSKLEEKIIFKINEKISQKTTINDIEFLIFVIKTLGILKVTNFNQLKTLLDSYIKIYSSILNLLDIDELTSLIKKINKFQIQDKFNNLNSLIIKKINKWDLSRNLYLKKSFKLMKWANKYDLSDIKKAANHYIARSFIKDQIENSPKFYSNFEKFYKNLEEISIVTTKLPDQFFWNSGKIPNLQILNLYRVEFSFDDFRNLEKCLYLKSIVIKDCDDKFNSTNFETLKNMENLESLTLMGSNKDDMSLIACLHLLILIKNLKYLNISNLALLMISQQSPQIIEQLKSKGIIINGEE